MTAQAKRVAIGNDILNNGILISVISVLCNSLTPLINKFALLEISPFEAAFFIATFTIVIVCLITRFETILKAIKGFRFLLPISLFNTVGIICLYTSIWYLSPVMIGFIGRFYIVFAICLSFVVLREKVSLRAGVLILLALVGTFMFVFQGFEIQDQLIGILLGFSYTFFFAVTNLLVKMNIKNIDSNTVLFSNNFFTLISVPIIGWVFGNPVSIALPGKAYMFLLLSTVITYIALWTLFYSYNLLPFRLISLIRSTSPILVSLLSWPFFPIKLTVLNTIGALLLLASVTLLCTIERS
ncbi:MAG: DMT family transporter [Desulfobacula sp.]|nr:DMT family transporter [Desulfobacula sp.]